MGKDAVQNTMEYYSAIKKNEIKLFCSNVDRPGDCHTDEEVRQRRNIVWHPFYAESIKK